MSDTAQTESGGRRATGFFRRNALVMLVAAVFVLVTISAGVSWGSQHSRLSEQEAQIKSLQSEIKKAELKRAEHVSTGVMDSLGISQTRLLQDARTIQTLADVAFTWETGAEYEQARSDLKRQFDLTEDDVFLQEFMPPSRYNEDASGKRYYYIDTVGLNSSVSGDVDLEVLKVVADKYTYGVLVDISVTSDAVSGGSGTISAARKALLFVTVDAQGTISDLSGVPASGSTRQSG